MAPDAQVEWEARAGRPAGAAAIASAVAGMGGLVYGNATLASAAGDDTDTAFLVHHHVGALVVTAVLEAVSVLLLAGALTYLFRAAKHRDEKLQSFAFRFRYLNSFGEDGNSRIYVLTDKGPARHGKPTLGSVYRLVPNRKAVSG